MANPISSLPDGSCKYCQRGLHDRCADPHPGEACPCPCPDPQARRIDALRKRIRYHEGNLRDAREELARLTSADPLREYRRPEDRVLGRARLEAATREMFPR